MVELIRGTTFRKRTIAVLIPTRAGGIDARVYASHCELQWPMAERTYRICVKDEVAVAYNSLFKAALDTGFEYALTLEDDMLVHPNTAPMLLAALETHPELSGVSVLYRTKADPGAALLLGHPDHPGDCGFMDPPETGLVECNVIPMGAALWRLSMFRDLPAPWFQTTPEATQDVHFCRNARAAGHRFAVDCGLRAGHLDVVSGIVY